ncbi:MAG: energy transducer TonB [Desulfarculaceae bacterium]|jgi:protein TonB
MSGAMAAKGHLRWFDWVLVGAGAAILNLVIFGAASLLQREVNAKNTIMAQTIQAFIPEEMPPPPETKPEPPPRQEPPKMKLKPLKVGTPPKERPNLQVPVLDLEMNTKLTTGVDLGPAQLGRYQVTEVDQGPMVKAQVPPMYPYHAKRQGIEGMVSVRFLVDSKGRVSKLSIIKADPPNVFENAVRRSLLRWSFRPGYKDGRPVDTWVETDIVFELEKK